MINLVDVLVRLVSKAPPVSEVEYLLSRPPAVVSAESKGVSAHWLDFSGMEQRHLANFFGGIEKLLAEDYGDSTLDLSLPQLESELAACEQAYAALRGLGQTTEEVNQKYGIEPSPANILFISWIRAASEVADLLGNNIKVPLDNATLDMKAILENPLPEVDPIDPNYSQVVQFHYARFDQRMGRILARFWGIPDRGHFWGASKSALLAHKYLGVVVAAAAETGFDFTKAHMGKDALANGSVSRQLDILRTFNSILPISTQKFLDSERLLGTAHIFSTTGSEEVNPRTVVYGSNVPTAEMPPKGHISLREAARLYSRQAKVPSRMAATELFDLVDSGKIEGVRKLGTPMVYVSTASMGNYFRK